MNKTVYIHVIVSAYHKLSVKPSSRTHKSIKKASVLILTAVITTVQIAAGIIPLQPVEAQDPIFGLPPTQNPAPVNSTVGNVTDPFGTEAGNLTDSLGGNLTDPFGTEAGNLTDSLGGNLTDSLDGNLTDSLDGNLTDGFGVGLDNVTDGFGAAGTEGFGADGAAGTEGFGADGAAGTEGFGAGGLNETLPEAPSPPPPTTTILSNNTGDSTNPNVAVSEGDMFVTWEDTTGGNREILFISSSDGKNFTTVQNLSHTTGDSLNPKLAVSGKNVYLVWEDIADTGGGQIMFAKSSDSGANFTSAKNLGNSTQDSANPNVAVSGNDVYVVWESMDMNSTAGTPNSEVMFAKSSDSGANFTSAKGLSNSAGNSANPNVAVSGNN